MFKKILIPTDGSALSVAASLAGVALARDVSAEIVGLFVAPEYQYPVFVDMIPPNYPTEEDHRAALRETGDAYLSAIEKAATDAGLKFSGITTFSDVVAQQIITTAEDHHCDLIFMGSHGRGGWGRLLLGSVTSKVLALCRIPVLVYRSEPVPG